MALVAFSLRLTAVTDLSGRLDVGHGLLIDHVTSELHKWTFINRMLFSNCY